MDKHIISLLVENNAGVLSRIAGLFSRRGYNIDSLSVGETESPGISRMTIGVTGNEQTLEQVKKQLNKLINTIKVVDISSEDAILRELVLIKVKMPEASRSSVLDIVTIFGAKVLAVEPEAITLEFTGSTYSVQDFINIMTPYGIIELIRSGVTGLDRKNTLTL
jgi:acetolactate synthase-1/3 small subunit